MSNIKPPYIKPFLNFNSEANSDLNSLLNAYPIARNYSSFDFDCFFENALFMPIDNIFSEAGYLTAQKLEDSDEAKTENKGNPQNEVEGNKHNQDKNNEEKEDNNEEDKEEEDKDNPNLTHELEDEDLGDDVDPVARDSIKALTEDESFSQPKSYGSILAEEFVHARGTFKRSNGSVFTSALMAGLEIGISYIVLVAVYALLLNVVSEHFAIVFASLLYPLGFITVVIGQSLLYTEQTSLLSLPVIAGIESGRRLMHIWSLVILGNVVGGCLFCLSVVWLGLQMSWFDTSQINDFANHVLSYPWWIILASAIVAGWLMGLAAWLATSARDTFSRIVLVAIITACIGVLGLHHSIVGNIEIFAGLVYGTDTSLQDYLTFLAWALLGNTIGGAVFVTVLKAGSLKYDIDKLKEERLEELRKDWKRFH